LRKVIATGVTAVAIVPSAMPEENQLLLLQQQIGRLTEAIQREMATDEERFTRIEEDIRQLKLREGNTTTVQPTTVQPTTVQPATVRPSAVRLSSLRPPRHRHYYPRYVWCPPPWWEPWW
jgi:cell division protein FtsN